MAEPADYEAFAADHPRDAQVPLILVEKTSTGFAVKVRGTELLGTVGSWDIALDPDDADLARKYAEPGEEMRGYVVRVNPERQRIDFTLIDPSTDPWRTRAEELELGAIHRAKVVDRHPRGYDVELFEGVVALLPKKEVGWDGEQSLADGTTLEVVVTRAPGLSHFMEVSARRATLRPGPFNDEVVDDWERALPADATFDDELRFRRQLAIDFRSSGLTMDESSDEDAPRETLLVIRDDVADGLHLLAVAHEGKSDAALEALAIGSVTVNDLDGPAALTPTERAATARVLAMVGGLDLFPWSASEWLDGTDGAPTEAELEALAEGTEVRELHVEGGGIPAGRIDGRIVAVTEITRVPD